MNNLNKISLLIAHPKEFMEGRYFTDAVWIPIIVLTLILTALHWVMLPELLATYDDPEYVRKFAEKGKLTETAAQEQVAEMRRLAPYLGFLEAPIVVSAGVAGVAVVLYLIGRIQFRKKAPYQSYFAMVAWGSFVSGIPLLINLAARSIKPGLLIATNAAALMPKSSEGTYFYNILLAVDPFLIWQVWLMGLGMAVLCEVNRQRAIASVGSMFVILSIVNALTMTAAGE